MDASVKKVLSALKSRKFEPVYFLQGEETYFIDRIAGYIEEHALSDSEKGFNQVVLYGKDAAMATILTHARRFPMMAERQVVIVKEAQDIPDLNKESGSKLLLSYLKQPLPSTVLVFCHMHKTLDKRRELGKTIDKLALAITTKKMYDNQLPDFVTELAAERKVTIEPDAVYALCELVGNDLSRLANEFDKLLIARQPEEPISAGMVLSQVGVSREYNIFELQKALIQHNLLLAVKIANYMGSNTRRNPVIPAVAFLYAFFARLLVASQSEDKSERGLVSKLKISPYAVRDYSQALRNYSAEKIIENISCLREADLMLKGVNAGSIEDGQILRQLIYRLMN